MDACVCVCVFCGDGGRGMKEWGHVGGAKRVYVRWEWQCGSGGGCGFFVAMRNGYCALWVVWMSKNMDNGHYGSMLPPPSEVLSLCFGTLYHIA